MRTALCTAAAWGTVVAIGSAAARPVAAQPVGEPGARPGAKPGAKPGARPGAKPDDRSELALAWDGPPGCPDAAAMGDRIALAAGGEDQARGAAAARAAPREAGGWQVVIDVGDGPRVLLGDSCGEVARAAALVIGIALRTAAELEPARRAQAGDAEVPWRDPAIDRAALEARLERTALEARLERRPTRWRPAVIAQAGALVGALPDPAMLGRAGLVLRGGSLAVRGEATIASAQRTVRLDEQTDADVRLDLLAGVASGCYVAGWLWLCGGLEVGGSRGHASAGNADVSGTGLWIAGQAGPSVALPLSRAVDLLLEAGGVVPLAYPAFSVNGIPLPAPDPVSIRAGAGVRVAFP